MTSGVSALVFAIVLGKRKKAAPPHNLPMTLLGAGLLWFGGFGFNAGSALGSNESAVLALTNTHIAAASAAVSWALVEVIKHKRATALGTASGLVAGLVAITPAAGWVGPSGAIMIGLLAGVVCFAAVSLKSKLGYDDSLDAFGIHGVGGALGAILTGVFAASLWNGGTSGLIEGNVDIFIEQLIGVAATAAYAAGVSYVLLKVLDATIGLRVDEDVEIKGLDESLHGEVGYHDDLAGARPE
jgi:Amt family ammonium transporter